MVIFDNYNANFFNENKAMIIGMELNNVDKVA